MEKHTWTPTATPAQTALQARVSALRRNKQVDVVRVLEEKRLADVDLSLRVDHRDGAFGERERVVVLVVTRETRELSFVRVQARHLCGGVFVFGDLFGLLFAEQFLLDLLAEVVGLLGPLGPRGTERIAGGYATAVYARHRGRL